MNGIEVDERQMGVGKWATSSLHKPPIKTKTTNTNFEVFNKRFSTDKFDRETIPEVYNSSSKEMMAKPKPNKLRGLEGTAWKGAPDFPDSPQTEKKIGEVNTKQSR